MAKRRILTRETVVAHAAEMADCAGSVGGVTLTALAGGLGVRTPSLYNHVAGLDDLHAALTLHALRGLIGALRGAAAGKVGREALLAMSDAYRRYAHAHPGIYPLTVRAPGPGEEELAALAQELLQMLLLLFASLGITGEDAYHAIRGLRAVLHGFVSLEAAEGYKMPIDQEESFRRLVTAYLDGVA